MTSPPFDAAQGRLAARLRRDQDSGLDIPTRRACRVLPARGTSGARAAWAALQYFGVAVLRLQHATFNLMDGMTITIAASDFYET